MKQAPNPLKMWLRRKNRAAKAFAVEIGISPEHLSRLCNGASNVTKTVAIAIEYRTEGGVTLDQWGIK